MFATVEGENLFYQDVGSGPPVILIPGLGQSHEYFRALTAMLQTRYRVIALDLRGIGQSKSARTDYSMESWADDVAKLVEHIDLGAAHILGSSLGGCVAQVFAHRYPDKTLSLITTASFSEIGPLLELNYRVRMDLIRATGMSDLFARLAITSLIGRTFYATERGQAIAAATIEMIRRNDKDMYLAHLDAVLKFGRCQPGQDRSDTFTKRLREIRKPALVIVGDEDVLTVPSYSRLIAEAIPGAKLVVQPRSGHVNIAEQPAETGQLVLEFLAGVSA